MRFNEPTISGWGQKNAHPELVEGPTIFGRGRQGFRYPPIPRLWFDKLTMSGGGTYAVITNLFKSLSEEGQTRMAHHQQDASISAHPDSASNGKAAGCTGFWNVPNQIGGTLLLLLLTGPG